MLPKFTVKQHGDRWFVETNWAIPNTALKFPGVTDLLQVSAAGRLDTASASGPCTRRP